MQLNNSPYNEFTRNYRFLKYNRPNIISVEVPNRPYLSMPIYTRPSHATYSSKISEKRDFHFQINKGDGDPCD